MHKVTINNKIFLANDDERLSNILIQNNIAIAHPCSCIGKCKKCLVEVDDRQELSCRYIVKKDITVKINPQAEIISEIGVMESGKATLNTCLVLDIGTTTLALALVSLDNKEIIKVVTDTNPQIIYGADVISRINYCAKNGVEPAQKAIVGKINNMIKQVGADKESLLYVSANTTMLHILLGISPEGIGKAPYTPAFTKSQIVNCNSIGINLNSKLVTLPSISAFVGADLVAGLNYIHKPQSDEYCLLIDLGTNAEIVLYNKNKILCTAAAAGPCFEGANISQGMSATEGAIYKYDILGEAFTINNSAAKGICGTGLVDVVAVLLQKGIIDDSGYLDYDKYKIAENVYITQGDIRQYQLAKSAVSSGIQSLLKIAGISYNHIQQLYIAGGFSAKIDVANAVVSGLLPKELKHKCKSIGNSSLLGCVKFALEQNDLSQYVKIAEYIDLSKNEFFAQLFVDNMTFELY